MKRAASIVLGAIALLVPLLLFSNYHLFQLTLTVAYAIAILGLNIVTGYNGQVSLGHGAFYAIGAYTTAILMNNYGVPYWATIPAAALICAGFGFAIGLPALRLGGLYLALVTFALAVAVPQVLKVNALGPWTGGAQGIVLDKPDAPFDLPLSADQWLYLFALAIAAVLFALARNLVRGRIGRAMMAVRDHPLAAEAMGVPIAMLKTRTFAISAFYTGIAGSIGAIAVAFVAPDSFQVFLSIVLFVGMVVGGVASLAGPVFGALFVQFIPNLAQEISKAAPDAVYGVALIAFLYLMPSGVAGAWRAAVAAFAKRRVVPLPKQTSGALAADAPQSGPAKEERPMLDRRTLLQGTLLAGALPSAVARAAAIPGVTKSTIKIGNTMPYSGPGSAYGVIGRTETAYFKMINDQGGLNGRKIDYISVDDGYSPPRTVEETRKLVEADGVAFLFNGLGTPTQTAVHKYLNRRKIPQLFVATGADKWGDPKHFPWTMGWQPSYRTEAAIYGKYLLEAKPGARIGILYQNDDFGKDYLIGLKEGLGDKAKSMIVKEASYETTDPTIDSQAISLQSTGCNTVLTAAIPKFAAQMIRKMADMNYKPLHIMSNVSISVGSVIKPAGPQNAVGMISAAYLKDNTDPQWKNDAGMNQWRSFIAKYMPTADINDNNLIYGYGVSMTMVQVLKQCGSDLSRASIMKQAASLAPTELPVLLPGIKVSTSATNFHPIRSMQLEKWNGSAWQLFGSVIAA